MNFYSKTCSVALILCCSVLHSCSPDSKNEPAMATKNPEVVTAGNDAVVPGKETFVVSTFEVRDTLTGKSLGWGFDINMGDGGKIHQPHIPAIEGIQSFHTKEDAHRTGEFMAEKIMKNGGMVGLTKEELKDLGVIQ